MAGAPGRRPGRLRAPDPDQRQQEPAAPEPGGRAGRGPPAEIPDPAADPAATIGERSALLTALGALPPRQRAVVVLRYWEDLSDAQAAALLGCSASTVRGQAARALAKLRASGALADTGADDAAGRGQAGGNR